MPCRGCSVYRRGAVGITKAVLGIDKTLAGTLSSRLAACQECPYRLRTKCGKCRCYIALKARVASETCPAGRWKS